MRRLTLCAFISLFVLIDAARAQDTLRFSGFDAPNLTPKAERILSRAYEELGIRIETVISSPAGRFWTRPRERPMANWYASRSPDRLTRA